MVIEFCQLTPKFEPMNYVATLALRLQWLCFIIQHLEFSKLELVVREITLTESKFSVVIYQIHKLGSGQKRILFLK